MGNINGKKYGFTGLFPIKENADCGRLRDHLRKLDQHPRGSPLSAVTLIHMARFVIIDNLPFQGGPAAVDQLRSRYLLFACEFDGADIGTLVRAFVERIPDEIIEIWQHCVGFPGVVRMPASDSDDLTQYFGRCQVKTNLLVADQPDRTVPEILKALATKQRFAKLLEQYQGAPPARLRDAFQEMWQSLADDEPAPGSL